MRRTVVACDQEGDLWAHFARRPEAAELLVRARHDRELKDGGSLFAAPVSWAELARYPITIAPRKIGEKPRKAMVAVRAGQVLVRRPESVLRDRRSSRSGSSKPVRSTCRPGYEPVL